IINSGNVKIVSLSVLRSSLRSSAFRQLRLGFLSSIRNTSVSTACKDDAELITMRTKEVYHSTDNSEGFRELEIQDPESSDEDEKTKKFKAAYHPEADICRCCRELTKREPEHMTDVNNYLFPDQLDEDEGAKLRIARYMKKWDQTGGFEMECPPCLRGLQVGFIYNSEHFKGYPNFQTMLNKALQFGIDRYNQETGNQMELLQILNVTVDKS
ncbi:hypothetical protein LINPERHAP1_LOCUS37243, partial [Linum perenne]